MIRRIMRLGDFRSGIEQWSLEQTPEAMEMGFSDVVQPCYIVERDTFVIVRRFVLDNVGVEYRSVLVVPTGERWVIDAISVLRTAGDRVLNQVAVNNLGDIGNRVILAMPGGANWISGSISLTLVSGMELSLDVVGGTVGSGFWVGLLYTRVRS